jgi:uncharacterized Zn finger protein (UPF0148 family)
MQSVAMCPTCGTETNQSATGEVRCPACGFRMDLRDFEWSSDDKDAEAVITALLAPKTPEEAKRRRALRDREDSETLLTIVRSHHQTLVEGLTQDQIKTLVQVAFRLAKGANEVLGEPEPLYTDDQIREDDLAAMEDSRDA